MAVSRRPQGDAVQRRSAARRLRAGAVDRRAAVGGFSLTAVALLCAAVFTRAPLPAIDVRDPAAARALVALMRVGQRSLWIATYDFTRTLANGRTMHQRRREARSTTLHVVVSGTAMTIEQGRRSYDCELVGARSGCEESNVGVTLPASELLRVAVAIGAYDVVRRPDPRSGGSGRDVSACARRVTEASPTSVSRPTTASPRAESRCVCSWCGRRATSTSRSRPRCSRGRRGGTSRRWPKASLGSRRGRGGNLHL